MVQIKWTDQAVSDLKEVAVYISRDSKKYAKVQVQRIKKRTLILKNNPHSGQVLTFLNQGDIRQLVIGSYVIIYKILSEIRIDILTVHHSARDLESRDLEF